MDLFAAKGIGTTHAIRTQVVGIEATVDLDGSVNIKEQDSVSITVTAANGDIQILAGNNIVANSVVITESRPENSIAITAANGSISVGGISAGANGDVSLIANGTGSKVTASSVSSIVTANVATVQATAGIGASIQPLNTDVSFLNATVTSNGDIYIQEASDVDVVELSTGNGTISLFAEGNVNVPNSGNGVVVAGTGDISLTANGTGHSFDANEVVSTSNGAVTIAAAKNVTLGSNGDISSNGDVSVTATTGSVTFHANTTLTAGEGNVTITGNGDVTITGITTTSDTATAVSITSQNGSIKDASGNAATDITATSANAVVTLSAKNEIDSIETDVTSLTATATNGNITITEANGLSNLSLSAAQGNVALTVVTGSVVDTDGSEDIIAKSANVTVSNGAFGTGSNSITTNVDVLSVDTTGANGDQFIKEVSGLTGLNLNAKNGNITLEVGGAVTDDETDADITANVATITANGAFGGTNAINTAVSTLSVATGPSAGNINVKEFDDVTLSKLSTANGSISFTADGNITVPNSGDGVVVSGTGNISSNRQRHSVLVHG